MDSRNMFVIYLSNRLVFPIPKRFLHSDQESRIRELLKSRINPGKYSHGKRLIPVGIVLLVFIVITLICILAPPLHSKSIEFCNEGEKKEREGDFTGAIALFDKAIHENPRYADAYNLRGFCKGQLDNITGELEDCSKAIALDTAYADAYLRVGYAKFALGDSLGTCEAFHKADQLGHSEAKKAMEENCN